MRGATLPLPQYGFTASCLITQWIRFMVWYTWLSTRTTYPNICKLHVFTHFTLCELTLKGLLIAGQEMSSEKCIGREMDY